MLRRAAVTVLCSAVLLSACSKQGAQSYAVEETPLSQVSADLADGKTTAVAVTQAYIDRIKQYDSRLHAVIAIAPNAIEQARASDQRRKEGHALGPLDGVPILLKDNIDVVGMPTTAGSFALEDNLPAQDSEVARRLKAAGAIILGKANTSQWAGLRTSGSFNGSTVGGSPKNPYDLTRSPAGSSSGPGIAAAVSFAAATVGTDTTGSIISPAAYNGVVGVRPTVALISRRGIVPVSLTQDTSGPLARNVKDAAMLLTVLAGSDPADPASKDADAHKTDYVKALDAGALKGKRLGVLRGTRDYSDENKPTYDAALDILRAQGAELVEIPTDALEDLSQEDRTILLTDFKEDIEAYLASAPAAVKTRTLADLIAFNNADPRERMHGQDLFEAAEATTGRQSADYRRDFEYAKRKATTEGYDRILSQYNVNAIVALTRGVPEVIPPEGEGGANHPVGTHAKGAAPPSTSQICAIAGYPDVTVPMGQIDGLPLNISFIGPAWSEPALLSLAYAFEQAAHKRIPPTAYKTASGG